MSMGKLLIDGRTTKIYVHNSHTSFSKNKMKSCNVLVRGLIISIMLLLYPFQSGGNDYVCTFSTFYVLRQLGEVCSFAVYC